MNEEALDHLFEGMDVPYTFDGKRFHVETKALTNDEVREIGACGARIEIDHMGAAFVVRDD